MSGPGARRGAPRAIDLGAIFRLIPGLMRTDGTLTGSVELIVTDGRGERADDLPWSAWPVAAPRSARATPATPTRR